MLSLAYRLGVKPRAGQQTLPHIGKQCLNHNEAACTTKGNFSSMRSLKYLSSAADPLVSRARLEGTTCMITGGSSGIGRGIAHRFLAEGAARIILVGRSRKRLEDTISQLSATKDTEECVKAADSTSGDLKITSFGQFSLVVGDVGQPSFWCDEVKKLMGQVDVLVNAAGVSYSSLLSTAKDEHIIQTLNTNLQGTIFACRAMARQAIRQKRTESQLNRTGSPSLKTKCIINISSLHASRGGIGVAAYASTKAGVIALTRAIVAESALSVSGANLRANVIVPGYIETKMLDELSEQFRQDAKRSIPLRRFGSAEEVADAAVFVAANQYANNCVLNLDGGLSAV